MVDDTPENISDSIRYQAKAIDDPEWIPEFLAEQETGVLCLIDDDAPHPVTQLFVYEPDAGAIYLHGARAGRAHRIVEANEKSPAAFTTSEKGRYIPADQPVNFTVEYSSVVAYGTVELRSDPEEKRRVLEQFMGKFAPHLRSGQEYERMTRESIDRTAIYRLDVDSWSGKKGWKDPDHPGAYDLDAVRD